MVDNEFAVIFDLDGTLIDSMTNFSTMVIKNLKQRGITDIKRLTDNFKKELANESRMTPSGPKIILIPKIFWKIGRKAGLSRFQSLFFTIHCVSKARNIYFNAPLFSDAKDSLTLLRTAGFKLGIYTLASRKELDLSLKKHNLLDFFAPNSIISRNEVKSIKPDPEGVFLAFERCSVHPNHGVYIGDMPMDIIAGNRAGATTIGVTTGLINAQNLKQLCEPDMIFDSLKEASNWILDFFLNKKVES